MGRNYLVDSMIINIGKSSHDNRLRDWRESLSNEEASSSGSVEHILHISYMSHGQSQNFMEATPLPRAMEYETSSGWRNPGKLGIAYS